jgi:hypothetical protein
VQDLKRVGQSEEWELFGMRGCSSLLSLENLKRRVPFSAEAALGDLSLNSPDPNPNDTAYLDAGPRSLAKRWIFVEAL